MNPLVAAPKGGAWMLLCFTKDATTGLMKIYQNGNLVASSFNKKKKFARPDNKLPTVDGGYGLTMGQFVTASYFTGAIDEIAIFDDDLSPADVDPTTGTQMPGVTAVRFVQMFQMGTN